LVSSKFGQQCPEFIIFYHLNKLSGSTVE
jgi:hypothetical protein